MRPTFYLGANRPWDGSGNLSAFELPAHHLVTHGVVVGMTGSGKTGMVTVLIEEALRASVPVLVIDIKSDLPNLLLAFPSFDAERLAPWVDPSQSNAGESHEDLCHRLARERRDGLAAFSLGEPELVDFANHTHMRVITPGPTRESFCTCSPRWSVAPHVGTPTWRARALR